MTKGIDYSGPGATCNRDTATGIRYGIIPERELAGWYDAAEPDYGPPSCPKCGNEALDYSKAQETLRDDLGEWEQAPHECADYACLSCKYVFGGESAFPDECPGYSLDDGEYMAFSDESGDVWCTKSPYYTRAQFCSPCAPGACYLTSPCEDGERAYCFGPEWFEGGKAPYPIWRVEDDSRVE